MCSSILLPTTTTISVQKISFANSSETQLNSSGFKHGFRAFGAKNGGGKSRGAQAVGMGKEAQNVPAATDFYILDVCTNGSKEKLDSTVLSQPAIYVTTLAAVEVLRSREGGQQIIDSVDVTCGLSLGEFTALAFAGSFSESRKPSSFFGVIGFDGSTSLLKWSAIMILIFLWMNHIRENGIMLELVEGTNTNTKDKLTENFDKKTFEVQAVLEQQQKSFQAKFEMQSREHEEKVHALEAKLIELKTGGGPLTKLWRYLGF
ncbi:hypothetical protein GIB67_034540 [Kingdonia uniflora]|uniref:Malonyl-CoA:ACP transacylase (MAT) domain-containing protein n=1 Tax=Kingdonia uniflora TaxID=39325 RepID=A0A7J7PBW1_9MAGN|nr:hypothetical protein GIB67_034540 [Kingdonia uniflora]